MYPLSTLAVVVGRCPPAPGRVDRVGAWFPAGGNAPRVGLRPFSSGRCCTGRGWALVCFSKSTTTSNPPVRRGTTGVVGNGINIKYLVQHYSTDPFLVACQKEGFFVGVDCGLSINTCNWPVVETARVCRSQSQQLWLGLELKTQNRGRGGCLKRVVRLLLLLRVACELFWFSEIEKTSSSKQLLFQKISAAFLLKNPTHVLQGSLSKFLLYLD